MQQVLDEIQDDKLKEKIIQKLAKNQKIKEEQKMTKMDKTVEQIAYVVL